MHSQHSATWLWMSCDQMIQDPFVAIRKVTDIEIGTGGQCAVVINLPV